MVVNLFLALFISSFGELLALLSYLGSMDPKLYFNHKLKLIRFTWVMWY